MRNQQRLQLNRLAPSFRVLLTVAVAVILFLVRKILGTRGSFLGLFIGFLGTAFLFLAGLLLANAFRQMKAERNLSLEEVRRERFVSDLSAKLLSASNQENLQQLTLKSIYSVTDYPSAMFVKAADGGIRKVASWPDGLLLYPSDEVISQCFSRDEETGRGTGVSGEMALHCYPVRGEDGVLAVVGILPGDGEDIHSSMGKTISSLLLRSAVAMKSFSLKEREQRILMEKELEHVRSDFLRTISHDLRTPLTGIIGACSVLEQKGLELSEQDRGDLIRSVSNEAEWLLRMVENLLSVTRVGAGGPKLNISEEPLEEVLAGVLQKSRKRFPDADIRVIPPDTFLMVPMDVTLIVQVLMNFIDNAVKYSGSPIIEVYSREEASMVSISVRDHGCGLSEKVREKLFEARAQRSGDSGHGMGLGLSLCASIIRAHGGSIDGRNAIGGGAVFTIRLPKSSSDMLVE